jgi:hypothetical protein
MWICDALLNRSNSAAIGLSLPYVAQIQGHSLWTGIDESERWRTYPTVEAMDGVCDYVRSTTSAGGMVMLDAEQLLRSSPAGRAQSWPILRRVLIGVRNRLPDRIIGVYLAAWGDRGATGAWLGDPLVGDLGTKSEMEAFTLEMASYLNGVVHFVSPDVYEKAGSTSTPAEDGLYLERVRWTLQLCKQFRVPIIPCVSPIYFPITPVSYVPTARLQWMVKILEYFADGWMVWGDGTSVFSSGESWIPIIGTANASRSGISGTPWQSGSYYWTMPTTQALPAWPNLSLPEYYYTDGEVLGVPQWNLSKIRKASASKITSTVEL